MTNVEELNVAGVEEQNADQSDSSERRSHSSGGVPQPEPGVVYRTVDEIANLTDVEIIEAIYEVGLRYRLSDDVMFEVFDSITSDPTSPIGSAISSAMVERSERKENDMRDKGISYEVRGHFTPEEKTFMIKEYPELNLTFKDGRGHDHGVAAACRAMDTFLLRRKTDITRPCIDVGGNPLAYLNKGQANTHCCCPKLDVKDAERLRKRDEYVVVEKRKVDERIRRRKVAGKDNDADLQKLERKKRLLSEFVKTPSKFYCSNLAQDCQHQAPYALSVHAAYDIPMAEWPVIMIRHGVKHVYGSMLYTNEALVADVGELKELGIVYDKDYDGFINFSFKGRATPMYSHRYDEYVRYGQTQTITFHDYVFLYRVVKYRRYSIDFEIQLISDEGERMKPLVPGAIVPSARKGMVKVTSLSYDGYGDPTSPKSFLPVYTYIDSVGWKRLMDYCSTVGDGITYDKIVLFARSLSQNIVFNNVRVSDGDKIHSDNFSLIATAAFAITMRMKYESEDIVRKFRRDVDALRDAHSLYMSVINRIYSYDKLRDMFSTWVYDPIQAFKTRVLEASGACELPAFFEMYDYEYIDWEEVYVEDTRLSREECRMRLVEADRSCEMYAKSNLYFSKEDAVRMDEANVIQHAFYELRDKFIQSRREDLLEELEGLSLAYTRMSSSKEVGEDDFDKAKYTETLNKRKEREQEIQGEKYREFVEEPINTEEGYEEYVEAVRSDPYDADKMPKMPTNQKIISHMLMDEDYEESPERVQEAEFEYLGATEDENDVGERGYNVADLEVVPDHPHIRHKPEDKLTIDTKQNVWRESIKEFKMFSAVQDECARNSAVKHVHDFVKWRNARDGNTGEISSEPYISDDIIALHGPQDEPNLLRVENGVVQGAQILYDKYNIEITVCDWMLGVDVTQYVEKGKSLRFVDIQKRETDEGCVMSLKSKDVSRKVMWIYVEKGLSVVLGKRFASAATKCLSRCPMLHIPKQVLMMEMVVGSGKSFFIKWAAKENYLVLTARKDAVGEFAVALKERGVPMNRVHIATADSFLLNGSSVHDVVFIDEATMLHFGGIGVICQIAKPKIVVLFGDREQIAYVIRDSLKTAIYSGVPDYVERYYSLLSRRITVDAAAMVSTIYNAHVMTTNPVVRGYDVVEFKGMHSIPMKEGCHYICFTNVDVAMVRRYFKEKKFKTYTIEKFTMAKRKGSTYMLEEKTKRVDRITTAHVAEGGTWKDVVIVRPGKVVYSIYSQSPHLLVAASRHTRSCTYVSAVPGDTLWKLMKSAKDMSDSDLLQYKYDEDRSAHKVVTIDGVKYHTSILQHPVYKRLKNV